MSEFYTTMIPGSNRSNASLKTASDIDALISRDPSKPSLYTPPRRNRLNILAAVFNILIPWGFFVFSFWIASFHLRYLYDWLAHMLIGGAALWGFFAAFLAMRVSMRGDRDATWYWVASVSILLAVLLGYCVGTINFRYHMKPFYDLDHLGVHPAIDVEDTKGSQLMDAGVVSFREGTHLDFKHAMGFKNIDMYCVAPIVEHDIEQGAVVDFWAIGINCCSGVTPDFRCGQFNNPKARAGLRMIDDDTRAFYRLAVDQAESAFKIRSDNPIFFEWMQDPDARKNAYMADGYRFFVIAGFSYLGITLIVSIIASLCTRPMN